MVKKKSKTKSRKSKKPRKISYKVPKLIEDGDVESFVIFHGIKSIKIF
jgi:hypothetical protein